MAISHLAHHFGHSSLNLPVPFVRELDRRKAELLLQIMERGVNSPMTSSCGRLFDAVAALIGIRQAVNYEAQAAIELEMAMTPSDDGSGYPLSLLPDGRHWVIGTRSLFEALLTDLTGNVPAGTISRRFHNGLVRSLVQVAHILREQSGLNRACLSGGVFQNVYLTEHLEAQLSAAGFEVFTHSEVPAGDGGISLGQALIAAHRFPR
jgi:hydrogenase maturation protein HypF